jgi:hypothetical protein
MLNLNIDRLKIIQPILFGFYFFFVSFSYLFFSKKMNFKCYIMCKKYGFLFFSLILSAVNVFSNLIAIGYKNSTSPFYIFFVNYLAGTKEKWGVNKTNGEIFMADWTTKSGAYLIFAISKLLRLGQLIVTSKIIMSRIIVFCLDAKKINVTHG